MSSIKVTGIDELQMKLKKNVQMSDVKKVVRKNGSDMQKKAQKNAPIDTGTLQRSITLEMRDSGKRQKSSQQWTMVRMWNWVPDL